MVEQLERVQDDAAAWYPLAHDAYLSIRFGHEGLVCEITSRKSAVVTDSSWMVAASAPPGWKTQHEATDGQPGRGASVDARTFVSCLQSSKDLADRPHGGLLTGQSDVRARVTFRHLSTHNSPVISAI